MEAQELLKEIKIEHANCRKAEERLRKTWRGVVIALLAISLIALVNVGILWQTTRQHGEYINIIRQNYVSYDNFFLFNRTYEMQLEHTQMLLNGDEEDLREIQEKYNELRSLIIRQPTVRRD